MSLCALLEPTTRMLCPAAHSTSHRKSCPGEQDSRHIKRGGRLLLLTPGIDLAFTRMMRSTAPRQNRLPAAQSVKGDLRDSPELWRVHVQHTQDSVWSSN